MASITSDSPSHSEGLIDHREATEALQRTIDDFVANRGDLKVLEAGCGSCTNVRLPPGAHLAGIDISEKQLDRNESLDEKILGDLQTHDLPSEEFDLIVCWYVLEHLDRPERALDNMVRSLKRGGLLVLVVPNVFSVKGLVTKFTPHAFHVWFYRHILGRKDAGTDERGPFKTYLRTSTSERGIKNFASRNGMAIVLCREFSGYVQEQARYKNPTIDRVIRMFGPLVRWLSLDTISIDATELAVTLERSSEQPAARIATGQAPAGHPS